MHFCNVVVWFSCVVLYRFFRAPAKRLQHFNATGRSNVGRNILRTFRHPAGCVATCWALKSNLCANFAKRLHHRATSTNVAWKIWPFSNLSQQHPTCRNKSQQGGQKSALNMLRSTMFWYVAFKCCDRLAGAKSFLLKPFYLGHILVKIFSSDRKQ